MATTRLNLTRDQLASFLKDHEQIKQFERLFRIADEVSAVTDTQGIQLNAENAQSMAQDALSQIARVAQDLTVNQAITDTKAEEALSRLEQLTKSIDANLTALQAIAMKAMETSAKLVPMVDMLAMAPVRIIELSHDVNGILPYENQTASVRSNQVLTWLST
jgi:hypothetical protein